MSAEIANRFNVSVAPRQFAERIQEVPSNDARQLAETVNNFFYLPSDSTDGDGNKVNLDDNNIIIPLPTKGGMSVMVRVRLKAKEFITLVLNPCQLIIKPLAEPLGDLLLQRGQSDRVRIAGPDTVSLPATCADSPHVSLLMILLLAKDLSLNRGNNLDQAYGAFIEMKKQFPSSTFGSIGIGAHAQQWATNFMN